MRQVGIMGGTFDPIHCGHLMLGRQAYEEYGLDKIWYMPSGIPPHKKDHEITDSLHRCNMVKLAIQDFTFMELSDFEIKRGTQNTYTADTLKLLRAIYKDIKFYFIIGADSLFQIERWYRPREIMKSTTLLVASREYDKANVSFSEQIAYLEREYHADIRVLHSPKLHVSSVEIRNMVAEGLKIRKLVPEAVADYIEEHQLYSSPSQKNQLKN